MEKIVKAGLRDCTVNLDGSECAVRFDSCFRVFAVRNDSAGDVFISKTAGIVPDADGVMSVKAGASTVYAHMDIYADTVYLLGKGKVQIHAQNDTANPFEVAPNLGGVEAEISELKQDLTDFSEGGKEVSGSSAYTIENAVDYPVMGLNLYGKSVQDGTPTPENPVEIVSVGDSGSAAVQACGKNLLSPTLQTTTSNGVTCTNNRDGTYTLSGTATNNAIFSIISNADFRKFAKDYIGKSLRFTGCPIGGNYSSGYAINVQGLKKDGIGIPETSNGLTIENISDFTSFNTVQYYIIVRQGYTCDNVVFKPMITTDLTATYDDFEPYNGATANITSALPLCGIPVESGGNYTDSNGQQWVCDELIYNADGSGKIVKRTAKIDSYNGESITTPYISTTGSLSTGATVIYQIAEPQEIELAAAEMSALRELQTFDGITNISNDGGADMSVNYCSNKMLSEYVVPITTALQKQIDELKSAVLSLGGNI